MVDAFLCFAGGYFMILSFQVAILSGINQGIITSLFSLTTLFVAVACRFLFKEYLKLYHYIGIGLTILCAAFIGLNSNEEI